MWKEYVRKAVASILAGAMLLAGVGGNVSASELDVEVLDTEVLVEETETETVEAELEETESDTEMLELETEESEQKMEKNDVEVEIDMDRSVSEILEPENMEKNSPKEDSGVVSGTYGTAILWSYNSGTKVLTISGKWENCGMSASDESGNDEEGIYISHIYPWTQYRTEVKEVAISIIENVASGAFYKFTNLSKVTMQDVTELSQEVFYGCINLTTIQAPKLRSVDNDAFAGCTQLLDKNHMFIINDMLCHIDKKMIGESVEIPSFVNTISEHVFSGCKGLKKVSAIGVKCIENNAFAYCSNLESVTFSNELEIVGWDAFESCTKLEDEQGFVIINHLLCGVNDKKMPVNVVIPNNVTQIANAFSNDTVQTITGSSVVKLLDKCVRGCKNLKSISFANVEDASEGIAYNCANLESVYLPKVKVMPEYAITDCLNLKSVDISSATYIGKSAFSNCNKITSLIAPNVVEIERDAFGWEETNPDYYSENGLWIIGKVLYSFQESKIEENLIIPEGVECISARAYGEAGWFGSGRCDNVKSITLPSTFSQRGIEGTGKEKYDGLLPMLIDGRYFRSLEKIEVSANNPFYSAENGMLMDKNKKKLLYYPLLYVQDSIHLPDTVETVGFAALSGCTYMTKFSAPSAKKIESCAFTSCKNLKEVDCPKLEKIEKQAFYMDEGKINLESFSNTPNLKEENVAEDALWDTNMRVLVNKGSCMIVQSSWHGATELRFPKGVVEIEDNFGENNRKKSESYYSLVASDVKRVGKHAFATRMGDIKEIDLPNATIIEENAFLHKEVEKVIAPNVTRIGKNAFSSNNLPFDTSGSKIIGKVLYDVDTNHSGTCQISSSVETIGYDAFSGCKNIDKIIIPATVNTIEKDGIKKFYNQSYYNDGNLYFLGNVPTGDGISTMFYDKSNPPSESGKLTVYYSKAISGWGELAKEYPLVKFLCIEDTIGSIDNVIGDTDTNNKQNIKIQKIKLTAPSAKLAAGKKVKLTATVSPANVANKSLKWTTSNKKYATVDQKGKVTLKSAGAGKKVTITASAKDGSKKKAACKITIMKHAVKSVKIKTSTKSIKAGKSLQLKTVIKTSGKKVNKTLVWSTSNKKYATVDKKGKVKTKKAGKGKRVTITAKSTDGSNKKATIKLKIK